MNVPDLCSYSLPSLLSLSLAPIGPRTCCPAGWNTRTTTTATTAVVPKIVMQVGFSMLEVGSISPKNTKVSIRSDVQTHLQQRRQIEKREYARPASEKRASCRPCTCISSCQRQSKPSRALPARFHFRYTYIPCVHTYCGTATAVVEVVVEVETFLGI